MCLTKSTKRNSPYRFKDYQDFEDKILNGVSECRTGDKYTVYGFLPEERKYDKSTLPNFETQLKTRISDGTITQLSITANQTPGGLSIFEVL